MPIRFLIIIVTTLDSIGITTLWVMDQLVFYRLLNSVFLVGLKMEKNDKEIPPIRSIMMMAQEGLGTHIWEKFFYIIPISIYILLSIVITIGGSDELFSGNVKYFSLNTRYISIFLIFFQVSSLIYMMLKFRSISQKDLATYFDDDEFTELVNKVAYDNTISQFQSKLSARYIVLRTIKQIHSDSKKCYSFLVLLSPRFQCPRWKCIFPIKPTKPELKSKVHIQLHYQARANKKKLFTPYKNYSQIFIKFYNLI